jgi:hypothetical protein
VARYNIFTAGHECLHPEQRFAHPLHSSSRTADALLLGYSAASLAPRFLFPPRSLASTGARNFPV